MLEVVGVRGEGAGRRTRARPNISPVSVTAAGPGCFSGLLQNNSLTCRTSPQSDKLRCKSCGSEVTEENCPDCGSYFPSEEQARVELYCAQVLAASSSSDCSSVVEVVTSLSPLLADSHHILLQAQHAVLQHVSTCRDCSNNQHTQAALSQISRLRQSLLATPLDLPTSYR